MKNHFKGILFGICRNCLFIRALNRVLGNFLCYFKTFKYTQPVSITNRIVEDRSENLNAEHIRYGYWLNTITLMIKLSLSLQLPCLI